MNACAIGDRGENLQYAQGWVLSLFLHTIAVSLAILIVADLHLVPQPEPFKWEVSVVKAPAQKPQDNPTQVEPASASPASPKVLRHQAQTKPVETTPVVQTMQAVPRIVRQEVHETKPPIQAVKQSTYQPSQQAPEIMNRTRQAIETSPQNLPVQSMSTVVNEAHSIEKETAIMLTLQADSEVTKQIVEDAIPITSFDPATMTRPVVETPQASEAVQERVVIKEAPTKMAEFATAGAATAEPIGVEHALIKELPARTTSPTKADFSWLAQALLSRVEQLKRYPHMARTNHWEGRVVIRAVILEDGQVIGVEVTESSGHSELDNDALDIVKETSPLTLKHPLGQPQVVVRVPIRYRIEH